jgi:hypothetical protein
VCALRNRILPIEATAVCRAITNQANGIGAVQAGTTQNWEFRVVMDSLIDIAITLSAQFAENASQHDSSGTFPYENFSTLYDKGLMSLTVARSAGGHGATLEQSRRVVSELAKGDGSTALAFAMHAANHAVIANGHWWPSHLARLVTETNRAQVALINRLQVEPEGGGAFLWNPTSDSCGVCRGWLANNGPEVLCYRSTGADMALGLRIYEGRSPTSWFFSDSRRGQRRFG